MIPCWLALRWSSWRLDRELAHGVAPTHSALHAARAQHLTEPSMRQALARTLRRVVREATHPTAGMSASAPPHRPTVIPWVEALSGLADALSGSAELSAGAVARTRLLVCDGTGPIYNPHATRSLADMIWWIADAMYAPPPESIATGEPAGSEA